MDVAAVRNSDGQHQACQTMEEEHFIHMGTISAAVGLGDQAVDNMTLISYNSTISSPGELGHLPTLFPEPFDTVVHTVSMRGLFVVYLRGQAASQLSQVRQTVTRSARGRLCRRIGKRII